MTDGTSTSGKHEALKFAYDIYKHLITLNTGSILILITLLDKLFKNPKWKLVIAISLCSFVVSLLSCLVMLLVITMDIASSGKYGRERIENIVGGSATVAAWGGFLAGIVSLVVFAIKNLY
jgi:hypothetical protein